MKRTINTVLALCVMIPAVSFAAPAAPKKSMSFDKAAIYFGRKAVSSMTFMGLASLVFALVYYREPIRRALASKPHARAENLALVRKQMKKDALHHRNTWKNLWGFTRIFDNAAPMNLDNDPEAQ
jgi:hypothetical protein